MSPPLAWADAFVPSNAKRGVDDGSSPTYAILPSDRSIGCRCFTRLSD